MLRTSDEHQSLIKMFKLHYLCNKRQKLIRKFSKSSKSKRHYHPSPQHLIILQSVRSKALPNSISCLIFRHHQVYHPMISLILLKSSSQKHPQGIWSEISLNRTISSMRNYSKLHWICLTSKWRYPKELLQLTGRDGNVRERSEFHFNLVCSVMMLAR